MQPWPKARSVVAVLLLLSADPLKAGAPLPYDLTVRVEEGNPPLPESLREELEQELVTHLTHCFRSVHRIGSEEIPSGELLFELTLDRLEEQVQYDVSLAQRDSPYLPPDNALRLVARIGADARLDLHRLQPPALVRSRKLRAESARRPLVAEDSRYAVRLQWMDRLVQSASSFLCKDSPQKFRRQLERAGAPDAR